MFEIHTEPVAAFLLESRLDDVNLSSIHGVEVEAVDMLYAVLDDHLLYTVQREVRVYRVLYLDIDVHNTGPFFSRRTSHFKALPLAEGDVVFEYAVTDAFGDDGDGVVAVEALLVAADDFVVDDVVHGVELMG